MIVRLAERHKETPAQIVIRWHLDLGNVVIPKSVKPQQIRGNTSVFGFAFTAEDDDKIAGLDSGQRIGSDPDTVGTSRPVSQTR